MSLARRGFPRLAELLTTTEKERIRFHETNQLDLRDRSPRHPPGRIQLRANITRGSENFDHETRGTGQHVDDVHRNNDHQRRSGGTSIVGAD